MKSTSTLAALATATLSSWAPTGLWHAALQNNPYLPNNGGRKSRNRRGHNRKRMPKSRRRMRNRMARRSRRINRARAKR